MTEERKFRQNQAWLPLHDIFDPNYKMPGWDVQIPKVGDDEKLLELQKVMSGKPKDRRLLTRYLVAKESLLQEVKLKQVLEAKGLKDVRKEANVVNELNKKILQILRMDK